MGFTVTQLARESVGLCPVRGSYVHERIRVITQQSKSAYYLYGNFGEKFPSNGTGKAQKTGTGLSCTIYKITINFSLSLDMKPGTSNTDKWYGKFRSFR